MGTQWLRCTAAGMDNAGLMASMIAADPALPPVNVPVTPEAGRLRLRTLGRGEGLLGMRAHGKLGPRGDGLTLVQLLPGKPLSPDALHAMLSRWARLDAAFALHPVDPAMLQWRGEPALGDGLPCYTLMQEARFADFGAELFPLLQAEGWEIECLPGYVHHSQPVEAWHLTVDDDTPVQGLKAARRQGSWLLSLGLDVAGERLDLAPLMADLLRRDPRWLRAEALAEIDPEARISLRAPGGRRLHCQAAPLKALMEQLLDVLAAHKPGGKAPLRIASLDAGRLAALAEQAAAWQFHGNAPWQLQAQQLQALTALRPLAPPPGLGLALRPYQCHGLAWLQTLRAQGWGGILADEMGLGKTAQTLAHIWMEKLAGRLDAPALVVMPTSLLFNWAAEAARITPALRVRVWHGEQRERADFADADLVLSTYGLVWRDLDRLRRQTWHVLILDEAQAVKNARTQSARALRRLTARHRLVLTGTPLENHLGELWAQFDFLMPGFLGDARRFARDWRKPIEERGEGRRARLLAARVQPFILRRCKDEVATELPPLTHITQPLRLEGRQKQLYESVRVAADHMVRRILARQGYQQHLMSVLDAMLKLRQLCCDPHLLKDVSLAPGMERAKLDWLLGQLPIWLAQGRRVLVFSQFAQMLALLQQGLAAIGVPVLQLTGATPEAERSRVVNAFQEGECSLMLLSLRAGGVGLNLTAADTVVHVEPWWNPAVQAQATARAHRIGQTRPVFVHQLLVEGSIEERMLALQSRKQALADGMLGSDEALATKFSPEELHYLLAPLDAWVDDQAPEQCNLSVTSAASWMGPP